MERPGNERGRGRPRTTDGNPGAEEHRGPGNGPDQEGSGRTTPPGHGPLVGPYIERPKRLPRPATAEDPPLSNRDRADLAAIRMLERQKADRLRARKAATNEADIKAGTPPEPGETGSPDRVTERRRR
ncbi:hypothetical protein DSECCO2_341570 [anaerobic digester metagenome]